MFVDIVVVVVYRPGSQQVTSTVFEEFFDLVELVASKAAPVFIVVDGNIHLDDSSLAATTNFTFIVSVCDMEQLAK